MKSVCIAFGLVLIISIAVNVRYLDYFGLCPPKRLLFQKDAEGLLEPLAYLEANQNLGTELRDLVFKWNGEACEVIGLSRW